jgi:Flp pilus assembly protein TadG
VNRAHGLSENGQRLVPRHRRLSVLRDIRGVTAIEFAIVAPVLLVMVFGILKFGTAMNHQMVLTNAAAKGAMTLALSRGTSTPYATTTTAVTSAAPSLTAGQISITVKVNGVACTSDAACSTILVSGQPALVKATYPCDLTVMGVNYKPGGCTLTAETAQLVQ